jgi:uncharacterized membrane protein YqaE (UPF0057 family)
MKRNLPVTVAATLGFLLSLSSCTSLSQLSIQKRQHRSGYYVDWGSRKVKHDPVHHDQAAATPSAEPVVAEPVHPVMQKNNAGNPAPADRTLLHAQKKPADYREASLHSTQGATERNSRNATLSMERIASSAFENSGSDLNSTTPEWLIIVLCILLPPAAVYITQGVGNPFWIDLTLAFLGLGILSSGSSDCFGWQPSSMPLWSFSDRATGILAITCAGDHITYQQQRS